MEAVTGKSWKDFLDDRIFKPAGMTRTTAYASRMYSDANAAIPCDWEKGNLVASRLRKSDRTMHAAGGLGSSIQDLGRWLRLNLNAGTINGTQIVSTASIAEMQKTQAKAKQPMSRGQRTREGYGLGWCVGPYHGKRMMDHGGGYSGASALITFMPEEKLGVAVVANANRPIAELVTFDIFGRLLDTKAPDDLPRLKKFAEQRRQRQLERDKQFAEGPVDAKALSLPPASYAGAFKNVDWGTIQFEVSDGCLSARWGDIAYRMRTDGTDRFLADSGSGDPDKAYFEIDADRVTAVTITVDAEAKLDARFTR